MFERYRAHSLFDSRRPALILGSAPNPQLPAEVDKMQLVCVNSSGWSAKELGLPTPNVTVLAGFKLTADRNEEDREALRGLVTENLVLIAHYSRGKHINLKEAKMILGRLDYSYQRLMVISEARRGVLVNSTTDLGRQGWLTFLEYALLGQKRIERPTNGVFAASLALLAGVPQVVLAGMSLRQQGHSYSQAGRMRKQVDQDLSVFRAWQRLKLPVTTSQVELAEDVGFEYLQ